jgi:hypothetical protein
MNTLEEFYPYIDEPFTDADVLLELREMVSTVITECTEATTTGQGGCGCGSADVEFELDGLKFNVSISLSEDEALEH